MKKIKVEINEIESGLIILPKTSKWIKKYGLIPQIGSILVPDGRDEYCDDFFKVVEMYYSYEDRGILKITIVVKK